MCIASARSHETGFAALAFGTFSVIAIQNGSSELSVHFDGAGSHKTGVAVLGRGIFL